MDNKSGEKVDEICKDLLIERISLRKVCDEMILLDYFKHKCRIILLFKNIALSPTILIYLFLHVSKMERKIFPFLLILILLLQLSVASPYLTDGKNQPNDFKCHDNIENSREFVSSSITIHVGVVCSANALLMLYECLDFACEDKFLIDKGYKVSGKLTTFEDFSSSRLYHYQCFECTDMSKNKAPKVNVRKTILVDEGEPVRLEGKCIDAEGDEVSLTYEGWMTSSLKETSYSDAGEYKVNVKCEDEWGQSSETIVNIKVNDVNRPPKIISVTN